MTQPDDAAVWAIVEVLIEADRTVSHTAFTQWHHAAELLIAAGYAKLGPVAERKVSCPTRLMDGRNEIRCWFDEGHEGDCK